MTNAEAQKLISKGVRSGIIDALGFLGVCMIIVTLFLNWWRPYDDTDGAGRRSGMELLTDCKTGLQYLSTNEGGLTPRLDETGTQIKEDCK